MTYTVFVDRLGDHYDESEHETLSSAAAALRELEQKWKNRGWYMVRVCGLDNIDIDCPDGLSEDEREELEILGGAP